MLRKVIIITMFSGFIHMFIAGGVFATEALVDEEKQVQEEREAIQSELEDAEDLLLELVREREQLNHEVLELDEAIKAKEKRIDEIENKIKDNEEEINHLESEIELLEKDIDHRFELLKDRARSYQRNGTSTASYLEVILGAENFGDFVSRVFSINQIAEADNHFIEQLELRQQELADVHSDYEETLHNLVNQAIELDEIHEKIEEQREETVQLRDKMEANEAEQEALISQLMNEDHELASKENSLRDQIEELRLQEEARLEAERQAKLEAKKEEEKRNSSPTVSRSNPSTSPSEDESSNSDENDWRTFTATAYTANCDGCSGVTSTGLDLEANPNAKVIAVDPNVIPLGSRVEVKGLGTFLAADTGSAIVGNKIDIFMNDRSDALAFGRQPVQIRVLE
ncbi:PcsB-like coiled-coil domain-containing protein [Evansella halocellulosilytica]|uniref:PcsB-like coiled-coil domain-containing protein n=1 Tax=Evansella halocellulosilytica TaxID=2011013 RepID=UPI00211C02CD|nr:3D domain-containing protein [Evansella halocellulosilytica]